MISLCLLFQGAYKLFVCGTDIIPITTIVPNLEEIYEWQDQCDLGNPLDVRLIECNSGELQIVFQLKKLTHWQKSGHHSVHIRKIDGRHDRNPSHEPK